MWYVQHDIHLKLLHSFSERRDSWMQSDKSLACLEFFWYTALQCLLYYCSVYCLARKPKSETLLIANWWYSRDYGLSLVCFRKATFWMEIVFISVEPVVSGKWNSSVTFTLGSTFVCEFVRALVAYWLRHVPHNCNVCGLNPAADLSVPSFPVISVISHLVRLEPGPSK